MLALLSDIKIEDETNKLFDELFNGVYPDTKKYPELQPYKGVVKDNLDDYIYWADPFEVWYYYVSGYAMRYVNNYYSYETYNPKTFAKNIDIAIDKYCTTQSNKVADMCRAEAIEIHNTIKKYKPRTIYNGEECVYNIVYVWKTANEDACEDCKIRDNKEFDNSSMIFVHWNCKCNIEEHIQLIDNHNNIVYESINIL